ncbi:hypothetical protein [Xenorhabdus stockiae]
MARWLLTTPEIWFAENGAVHTPTLSDGHVFKALITLKHCL